MANYQFENPEGTPVKLALVDAEMCRMCGISPDPIKYSDAYNFVVWTAMAVLMREDGNEITKDAVDSFVAWRKNDDRPMPKENEEFLREMTYNRFTFKAWR